MPKLEITNPMNSEAKIPEEENKDIETSSSSTPEIVSKQTKVDIKESDEPPLPWAEFIPYASISKLNDQMNVYFKKNITLPKYMREYFGFLDDYFECTRVGSSIRTEITAGIINFFSSMYIIAVVPPYFANAGYNPMNVACAISLLCGFGSIAVGLLTNTPLIISPTAAVSIYFASNLLQYNLSPRQGNMAITYAGLAFTFLGVIGPLGRLVTKLIPKYIQAATTVGIGLITVLSGFVQINLVEQGKYTLLSIGNITDEVVIAISTLIIISIGVYYKSKSSFLFGLVWGTFIWWTSKKEWPTLWAESPHMKFDIFDSLNDQYAILLVFQIVLLILLSLFGLAKSLCDLALITLPDDSIPKGRVLVVIVGVANIISGFLYGPPIILSSDASGIKSGAKTGLCSFVCGSLYVLSVFFAPFFTSIPHAAISPILIMGGMTLFQNIKKIDFSSMYAIPAFICLTLIPFSNSIIAGLGFGYVTYAIISVITGDVKNNVNDFVSYYFPDSKTVTLMEDNTSGTSISLDTLKSLPARSKVRSRRASTITLNMETAQQAGVDFVHQVATDMNFENDIDRQILI